MLRNCKSWGQTSSQVLESGSLGARQSKSFNTHFGYAGSSVVVCHDRLRPDAEIVAGLHLLPLPEVDGISLHDLLDEGLRRV